MRFEDQRLTSFAGLVVLQKFFQTSQLKTQLQKCFRHQAWGKVFDRATLFLQLVIHLLLGFRELLGQLVLERLASLALPRITLDFDGSV